MSLVDLTFEAAEWLRSTSLPALADSISASAFSQMLQSSFWIIPSLQSLHILGIAALFGSSTLINLRVLGLYAGDASSARMVARFGPWIFWGFIGLLVTGLLLVIAEPARELVNPVFWFKMILIVLALLLSTALNRRILAMPPQGRTAAATRMHAIMLLLLWCLIIFAGRWIGYAPI